MVELNFIALVHRPSIFRKRQGSILEVKTKHCSFRIIEPELKKKNIRYYKILLHYLDWGNQVSKFKDGSKVISSWSLKTRTQLTLTQALQSWAVLMQSSWQKAPHFLQTSIAFNRHEQLLSNIDRLKFLAETTVDVEPLLEAPPVTAPRRVKFSLLAAACWRIAARDGGLGFISEEGERNSTPSLESIDALEIEVADDSLDKELSDPASLHGVFIVRFFA